MSEAGVELRVEDLWVSYRRLLRRDVALRGAEMTAAPGRVTAIIGRNGSGKTTLFRTLLGLQTADRGACTIDGLAPREYRMRQGIGYVPEAINFPRGWTVADVLARGADLCVASGDRRAAFSAAVDRGRFEPAMLSKHAARCSKGMQQRLLLAYALIGEPRVVLLDEPFSGLDPPSRIALRADIHAIRARGSTVLLASHDLAEVDRVANTVFLISEGAIRPGPRRGPGSGFGADLESAFLEPEA